MAKTKEGPSAPSVQEAQAVDAANSPAPGQCHLYASAAASAHTFAILAVPSHAQTSGLVEAASGDVKHPDKPSDPISEAGWLAAADALLMGGLLGDW